MMHSKPGCTVCAPLANLLNGLRQVTAVFGTVNNGAEEIGFFSCADASAYSPEEVWYVFACCRSFCGCARTNGTKTQ